MTTLTLISKPDCHLCDVAREIIDVVISELPESDVEVAELSILDDQALYATWWEKIPVVLIDDDWSTAFSGFQIDRIKALAQHKIAEVEREKKRMADAAARDAAAPAPRT